MQNRLVRATLDFGRREAGRGAALALVLRDTVSGFFTTARHTLTLIGLLALCVGVLAFARPDLLDRVIARLSPAVDTAPRDPALDAPLAAAIVPAAKPEAAEEEGASADLFHQQQRVANWIARRYRVASDATHLFVHTAYNTARELKLDPLLILSVIAIESRFNPFAESPVGAQGLMQVMSRVHKDKFEPHGGISAALNPVANIKVGSRILKDYVTRTGSIEAGLKMYVGAAISGNDAGYGAKVMAEYERLKNVAMGRKVSIYATTAANMPAAAKARNASPAKDGEEQPLAQAEQALPVPPL